jgi:IclR family acetate operon transcriptional repressor
VKPQLTKPFRTNSGSREPRVQSVAKAIEILMAVASSNDGIRAIEISRDLNLPRQATYHLLHTLVTVGILTRGSDNRYLLGLRVGALVEAFSRHLAPPERLLPFLREAEYETGETAYAVGWVEGEIVTLAIAPGRNAGAKLELPQGTYADAHSRASGKLMLALADDVARREYFSRHVLKRRTPKTIVKMPVLEDEFAKIRKQGYAFDNEEYSSGHCCIAVPFYEGAVPYALCLSGPTKRIRKFREQYLSIIRRLAASSR